MKLYSVSISGKKYYFLGIIPSSLIALIDDHCGSHNNDNSTHDPEEALSELYRYIRHELKCNINTINIEHIFRINL